MEVLDFGIFFNGNIDVFIFVEIIGLENLELKYGGNNNLILL